jgi:hypothetical protein
MATSLDPFFTVRRVSRDPVTLSQSTDYMVRSPAGRHAIHWEEDVSLATRFSSEGNAISARTEYIAQNAGEVWIVSLDVVQINLEIDTSTVATPLAVDQDALVAILAARAVQAINNICVIARENNTLTVEGGLIDRLGTVGLSVVDGQSLITPEELSVFLQPVEG